MNRTLLIALLLASVLLAAHLQALQEFAYWYYPWLDIPMHVLGGAAIGTFLLAFFSHSRTWLYFGCMFLVVLGWEVFEYFARVSTGQPDYWIDTVLDIANGLAGAALALIVSRRSLWH